MSEQLAEKWNAQVLTERLTRLAYRARGTTSEGDWHAILEAIRRVRQHEVIVEEVLPELRAQTQAGWARPTCCP